MHTEASRALIKEAWATFASCDPHRISMLFTEDAQWIAPQHNGTAVALNGASHMVGAPQIANFIAIEMRKLFVAMSADIRGFFADGSTVIVEARLSSPLPNGEQYENDYCFVFCCRDGRIAQVREYMDTYSGHRQLFRRGHPLQSSPDR